MSWKPDTLADEVAGRALFAPPAPFAQPGPSGPDSLLGNALGASPQAVLLVRDRDHRIEFANEAFREGFQTGAGPGRPIREAVPQLDALGLLDALDHVYATGTVYTAPEIRLGGFGPARRPVTLRVTC